MIKRIIFDIDNTLIPWKNEYEEKIKKVLNDLKIEFNEKDYEDIKLAFDSYEDNYYTFNKKAIIDYINKVTGKNYPDEFIYNVIDEWGECVPEKADDNIIKTLKYLNLKYELVILTDWFKEPQKRRLEKINILGYFNEIYSAENTKRKPFKEAFIQATGSNKPEECIMIGDNLERDIKGALNVGINAIFYNVKNKKVEENGFKVIKDLKELNNIL